MRVVNASKSVAGGGIGGLLLASLWIAPMLAVAQSAKDGVDADAIVTVMAKHGKAAPPVPRDAVNLSGKGSDVESWTALTGIRAGLQLLILMDDSSSGRVDSQIAEMKRFVAGLPPTTEVAIGYMQNGRAAMKQNFTFDHNAAAHALRATMSIPGGNGSPYFALEDVVKHWPGEVQTPREAETGRPLAAAISGGGEAGRREILMVTDGVDRYNGPQFDPEDQYVLSAIMEAQRASVVVHSIYFSGAGRFDNRGGVAFGGQNYLMEVAKATGGECYYEGLGNPVSFRPFLDDLNDRLQHQYELSFMSGERAEHGLVPLKLKIQLPGVTVDAPEMAPANGPAASGGMK